MPKIVSNFETDAEGWTISDGTEIEWEATGGNPGGHIGAPDSTGEVWYFEAGPEWLGNLRDNLGGTLSYSIRQNFDTFQNTDPPTVSITGANGVTIHWFGPNPGTTWTDISVTLDIYSGWRLATPFAGIWREDWLVSEDEIRDVLLDVTSFRIRGEYRLGADEGDLDQVVLTKGKDDRGDSVAKDKGDLIRSTFAHGGEGWGFINDVQEFRVIETAGAERDGLPGYLEAVDRGAGEIMYFVAPEEFTGRKGGFYKGTLKFSLQVDDVGSAVDHPDVVLIGKNGTSLYWELPENPGGDWTSYRVAFNTKAGWTVGSANGPEASRNDIQGVLRNISELRITGEFRTQGETTGLDEVELKAADKPFDIFHSPRDRSLVATEDDFQEALNEMRENNVVRLGEKVSGDFTVPVARATILDPDGHLSGTLRLDDPEGTGGRNNLDISSSGQGIEIVGTNGEDQILFNFGGRSNAKFVKIDGKGGDDSIVGAARKNGSVFLRGGDGKDTLLGGDRSADTLNGGAHKDELSGFGGNDKLIGGGGPDRFVFVQEFDKDQVRDFNPAVDKLVFSRTVASSLDDLEIVEVNGNLQLRVNERDVVILRRTTDESVLNDTNVIFKHVISSDGLEFI